MSFYSDASLVMIPSGYKDAKVYSAKPVDGSGDLDFSRGSDIEATRVNSQGYIEKAKVNLLLQSNTFSTTWTTAATNSSATSGQTDPNGGSTAWLITESSDGGSMRQSVSVTGVLTFSMYLKYNSGSATAASLFCTDNNQNAVFDLSAGTITSENNLIDSSITSIGGGWYRCSITLNASAASTMILFPNNGAGIGSCFAWHAQLNYGLVAQEYQETTTAAVVTGITNDMPRLNYDPANPTCCSLLLEPSRQNKFEHSEYFGASYWAKNNGTITDNATTSPEGVVNAAAFTENSSTSTHFMQSAQVVASASTYYSASFFVKYNGRHFQIVGSTGSEGGGYVNFDLVNGVVGNSDQLTGTIENYGGGWYRCTGTNISTSSATEIRLLPYLITSATSARAESYAGNGTSGIYIYGAQMEEARYQSSMVPTYGTSATRTADACSKTGISSLIGQTEGTIFGQLEKVGGGAENLLVWMRTGATSYDEMVQMGINTSGAALVSIRSSATNQFVATSSTLTSGVHKFAVAYKANDFAFYVDGVQIATSSSGSVPTCDQIYLNGYPDGGIRISKTEEFLLFKTRLSNADLATLTTL